MNNKNNYNGVVTGNKVKKLLEYAKSNNFAIPAINCINTDVINCVLESASIFKSPVIIQFSYNGASYFSGYRIKEISENKYSSSVIGAISGAIYIHNISKYYDIPIMIHTDHCNKDNLPWLKQILDFEKKYLEKTGEILFSSHMIDLSKEKLKDNIDISKKFFNIMNNINLTLEIELGCTGSEEDGINDKKNIINKSLYTNPNDVVYAYKELEKISSNFIIAASFGNVHGVYKKGNIKLDLNILKKSQNLLQKEKKNNNKKIIDFVFHGGSGSNDSDIKKSIEYGVVKVNIDTDIQWANWLGILKFYKKNKLYLQSQIGNPDNLYLPNKKYYDPRVWLREGQLKIIDILKDKFILLNSINTF